MSQSKHDDIVHGLLSRFSRKDELEPLLHQALVHRSWINEHQARQPRQWHHSNERLEFLGDAVLGLVITEALIKGLTQADEGQLSKFKSFLVSTPVLAKRAQDLDLGEGLLLGQGEIKTGGRKRASNLADAMEAVIGAIYMALGINQAKRFILSQWRVLLDQVQSGQASTDYKTSLQELTQKYFGQLPDYNVVRISGPDHQPQYEVKVMVGSETYGVGIGASKKEAEQRAAAQTLEKIKKRQSHQDQGG